ncbi:MAG: MBL fold metallo-hydrolase [Myxococcota bacterium]
MQFVVLSSGSKGNCLLVKSGDSCVMVEAGLGPRVLKKRLSSVDLDPRIITGVVVTHGHYDHIRCAPEVAESLNVPTLATTSCAVQQAACGRPLFAHQSMVPGEPVRMGRLTVTAFPTPHDAPGSIGLVFQDDEARLGVVTDLGCITPQVLRALSDLDGLYLEFNHDVPMLLQGTYPDRLKRRVRSNLGHLSNEQAAELVMRAYNPRLRQLFLAHLSEQNNTPGLAWMQAQRSVDGRDVEIVIAPQQHALRPVTVGKRGELKDLAPPADTIRPPIVVNPPPRDELLERYALAPVSRSVKASVGPRTNELYGVPVGKGPAAQLSLFEMPVRERFR